MNLVKMRDRIVGFRPECFLPRQMYDGSSDVISLSFEVNRIENLGADRLVYGKMGERFNHAAVIANLPTHFTYYTMETCQSYDFVVPRKDVKFFDSKTGLSAEPIPL
jgi:multiple sugar transport system ATP-binding protein